MEHVAHAVTSEMPGSPPALGSYVPQSVPDRTCLFATNRSHKKNLSQMVLDRITSVGEPETSTFYFLLHPYRVILTLSLEKVHWNRRLLGRAHRFFKASVDGTDFRIQDPVPFSEKWYSYKFKGPGLRYEVGLSV